MDQNESKNGLSRRDILKAAGALSAGAAVGVPALVFLGGVTGGGDHHTTVTGGNGAASAQPSATGSSQPLVAFVRDASRGEVSIMYGTQEVVLKDPQLVARLMGAVEG